MTSSHPLPDAGIDSSALEAVVRQTIGAEALAELSALLPVLVRDLADVDWRVEQALASQYSQLGEAARYACSTGGKRVRPLLMATMARALGATSTQPLLSLAAAFQLIHTASLVHDDVIDHADLRRGRPSMPRAYGTALAIVTGDYLFVRAFELAAEYPKPIILRCGEACAELVEGEVLQENTLFDLASGREHYFRVVERKTASIVAAALSSVAELAGAPQSTIDAAGTYGRSLGISFQIRDDLLDVYGDPDLLGKPLYADFREGNPTLVAIETYARLDPKRQTEFERLFQRRHKKASHLIRMRELADAAGVREPIALESQLWAERAIRALAPVPPGPYRVLLERLAHGAAERRF
ncbi:MAG: polyprenyl synthetase family protein [Thermoplasmata archaeon]|nr:polyprenyl synthetase family protein [Thermoplasmata archaeon]